VVPRGPRKAQEREISFPFGNYFGNVVEDKNADPNTVYLFSPRYKMVPADGGLREEIDWEATAKASAMIYNIGDE
jgi:hypothetical protein